MSHVTEKPWGQLRPTSYRAASNVRSSSTERRKDQRGICAAEAEAVGQGDGDGLFLGMFGDKVEGRTDVWVVEVEGGRDDVLLC